MRILIVDDATFMRITLEKILTSAGHEVVAHAENGMDALTAYREHKPDLVTMDITMPEVDGLQGLQLIREVDSEARVIMVSAMGQESIVGDAIKAGARDFIVKPFHPERVLAAVERISKK